MQFFHYHKIESRCDCGFVIITKGDDYQDIDNRHLISIAAHDCETQEDSPVMTVTEELGPKPGFRIDESLKGRKIRLRYRLAGQRREREAVMVYLGKSLFVPKALQFSALPAHGTQILHREQITGMELMPDDTPIFVNKIVPDGAPF